MKRFFAKLGRFFWSRGFLIFVLAIIALVILFYVEEDWRGARAWAATKAEWEAKGETFNYTKFIPPPVPDDQNLAAIPLFKLEPVKDDDGTSYLESVALRKATRTDTLGWQYYPMGEWQQGESSDMTKVRAALVKNYATLYKDAKPPDDILDQFNAIYPFFADFMHASSTHPLFRFNSDFTVSTPLFRPLGPIDNGIKLSQILTLHAVLALDHGQPGLALQDIETNFKVLRGTKNDPSLVGSLIAIGMATIHYPILYDGLGHHSWTDAQLAQIEQTYASVNFLSDYQFAVRSEAAGSTVDFEFFKRASPRGRPKWISTVETIFGASDNYSLLWPGGWWDDNLSQLANFHFQELATVDPKARLVFPKINLELKRQAERAADRWDANAPWNFWYTLAAEPFTDTTLSFAKAQVWLDEARIACALERYHLAHNAYPESLPALVTACIDELPHDVMSGEQYHYQLRPDDTYLLYSVGWNQTDDGGKFAFKKDNPKAIDYENGDWPWPTPQPTK